MNNGSVEEIKYITISTEIRYKGIVWIPKDNNNEVKSR